MKFEVRYPTGTTHEVELQGTVAVLGREPTCDLVLNDVKCSRRHAVVEAGPDGMTVRDTGSANGVYVNGTKVERAPIKEGDEVRLGEIVLKVLSEKVPGTLVMAPHEVREIGGPSATVPPTDSPPAPSPPREAAPPRPLAWRPPGPVLPRRSAPPEQMPRPEVDSPPTRPSPMAPPPLPAAPAKPAARRPATQVAAPASPRPSPRVPPSRPVSRAAADGSASAPRPMVLTLLAVLWITLAVLSTAGMVVGLAQLRGPWAVVVGIASPILAATGAVMALGLWTARPWAHRAQVALAWVGIFSPVSLGAIVVLVYMLRPESRLRFSGRDPSPEEADRLRDESADLPYTFAILGGVFLSLLLTGLGFLVARSYLRTPSPQTDEARAVVHLKELATAQANFQQGTACGSYADLEGLLNPAAVIPNYRPDGPSFLRRDFKQDAVRGYEFRLDVVDPVRGSDGCPSRSYRRFEYAATPEDRVGRHFRVGPDRVVRAALGRPAKAEDPPVE